MASLVARMGYEHPEAVVARAAKALDADCDFDIRKTLIYREGRAEGRVEMLRQACLDLVRVRHPRSDLSELEALLAELDAVQLERAWKAVPHSKARSAHVFLAEVRHAVEG